jgi:hypothetical protein
MKLPPPKKKASKGPPPKIPGRKIFRAATQESLFEIDESVAKKEWQGMPEFISNEMLPFHSLNIHFENREAISEFSKLIDQKVTEETPSVWYPKKKLLKVAHLRYSSES